MIPTGGVLADAQVETLQSPSRTYRLDLQRGRMIGMTDGLEAIRQFIYKTLLVRRFAHPIYSADYGSELTVNAPLEEMERWVREALLQDSRILEVSDFRAEESGDQVVLSFSVDSLFAQTEITGEVSGGV